MEDSITRHLGMVGMNQGSEKYVQCLNFHVTFRSADLIDARVGADSFLQPVIYPPGKSLS